MIKFSGKVYDALKRIAQVWLPAAGTLYYTLAAIWGLPAANNVVGSITAVDLFLGVILGISSLSYSPVDTPAGSADGSLVIDKSDTAKDIYRIELTTPLSQIDQKNSIRLSVKS